MECAWEVCNQVGGIYTVIRSKTPEMVKNFGDNYFMIGPYISDDIQAELDYVVDFPDDPIGKVCEKLSNEYGWKIHNAVWLITGRPRVILFDISSFDKSLDELKYFLWKDFEINSNHDKELVDSSIVFGFMVKTFLIAFLKVNPNPNLIAHFHEWQASLPILYLQKEKLQKKIKTVFTTHATILGRYLAINSPFFYNHLPFFDWKTESAHFGIEAEVAIEVLSAKYCDVLTTVSDVTGKECKYLLKRKPDKILPNGLNITRFEAFHEFQNLHQHYKKEIHDFVMGHFFSSYPFELDKTLYFFTSGRYEYKNKGYDLTLQALYLLDKMMKAAHIDKTVVMFIVTRKPNDGIKADLLHSRGIMQEINQVCESIEEQMGKRLFYASTTREDNRLPDLNEFVDDYWKLRYRRTIQSWKTNKKPDVVTHNLVDEVSDDIIQFLNKARMDNSESDKVKIVYHPDFITPSNPLFGIEYGQFVRGCHLGIFPSYYEPWGYTPLECMASGVPSVTSDLAGFGDFVKRNIEDHNEKGIMVIERAKKTFQISANQLADVLFKFVKQDRRERIMQRNNTENYSTMFSWSELISYYMEAYSLASQR